MTGARTLWDCGSEGRAWLPPASLLMPGPPGAPTLGLALPGRLPALAPPSSAAGSGETGIAEKPAGVSPVSRYFSASARPSLNACKQDSTHGQDNTSLSHNVYSLWGAWTDAVLPIMRDDAVQCDFPIFVYKAGHSPWRAGSFLIADVGGHELHWLSNQKAVSMRHMCEAVLPVSHI